MEQLQVLLLNILRYFSSPSFYLASHQTIVDSLRRNFRTAQNMPGNSQDTLKFQPLNFMVFILDHYLQWSILWAILVTF